MKAVLPLAVLLLLAVAACDRPKPRPAAAAAAAAAAAEAAGAPVQSPGAANGLVRRPEMAVFSLDMINAASDPLNNPARITAGVATTFTGFGFDPVAKATGKAIDIVIDDVAYGAACCHERQDVAGFYKTDAVLRSGFRVTLPAGTIKPGPHLVVVRVVSADGKSYFDSTPIAFTAD